MKLVFQGGIVGVRVEFGMTQGRHYVASYDDERDVLVVNKDRVQTEAAQWGISFDERLAQIVEGEIAFPHVLENDVKWREKTNT